MFGHRGDKVYFYNKIDSWAMYQHLNVGTNNMYIYIYIWCSLEIAIYSQKRDELQNYLVFTKNLS